MKGENNMLDCISLVDCTIRESGYQTGWYFDKKICRKMVSILIVTKG
jgi:hypothetical protein